MRISAKAHYAVRAMLDIASNPQNYPISLSSISVRQEISLHYLEQLFMKLRKSKLVKSVRGPGGGYLMAKKADQISIGDIFRAVDESISPAVCVDTENFDGDPCNRVDSCVTRLLWQRLAKHISDILYSISLEDLRCEEKNMSRDKSVRHTLSFEI